MDGRARDAYHPWKIIMCRQGRKWMSRLTKDSRAVNANFSPDLSTANCYHFSYWNLSPSLCFVHSLVPSFLPISEPQSAGFSSEPPTRPFSLHLGVWLPKQMGLGGEEKLKVKQQTKRTPTPSLCLCKARVQATEGIPTDKTTTDFNMTRIHKFTSQENICFKRPPTTLFPACPICILLDTSHHFLWHAQPDKSCILG